MKEWYRQVRAAPQRCALGRVNRQPPPPPTTTTHGEAQVRGHNATALAFLVGTKYDLFYALDEPERVETLALARKYAKAMKAPLVFCSASHGINVQKLFKLVFQRVFSIEPDVEQKHDVADAVLEY
jgi:Gtp-binding protein of the ras superfamily involved in termination of M-phase